MALGQKSPALMGEQAAVLKERDWVKYSLAQPFIRKPGSEFQYNNVGPYLAGILVQRRAGCDLVSYLTPRLFEPLGIVRPTWEADPLGYTLRRRGTFFSVFQSWPVLASFFCSTGIGTAGSCCRRSMSARQLGSRRTTEGRDTAISLERSQELLPGRRQVWAVRCRFS